MEKIRTATKNFLCEKCNQLIKEGDRYYDWWNTISKDVYYHKRFHVDCVTVKNPKITENIQSKKADIFKRLQIALDKENGCLLAVYKGIKCYVCGIHYAEDGTKSILCESWGDKKPYYETVENFKKYIDCDGNYF